MRSAAQQDERLFRALADGTRRTILDLLRDRPLTTGELAAQFAVSRYAVMKHLKVLEEAGLVLVVRDGRRRINHLNPVPLREIYHRWMKPIAEQPADKLLALKRFVEQGGATPRDDENPTDS